MSESGTAAHATWRVTGLDCPDCADTLNKALELIPGVTCADLNYASGLLLIDYRSTLDPRSAVVEAVLSGGYGMVPAEGAGDAVIRAQSRWIRHRTTVAVVGSGVAGAAGWSVSALTAAGLVAAGVGGVLSVAFYLVAVAFGLVLLLPRAMTSLRARSVDMNALMVIAVAGAVALGEYSEAAAVVFLFAIGGWLESRAVARTRGSIRELMELAPAVARVRRDGVDRRDPPGDVVLGETVIVRPGERFPLDGVVSSGTSAADEAAITGESVPVDKGPGDRAFAGSLNTIGLLEVTVTAPASDSTLARIVYLVEEAAAAKAPTQLLVDRFSRVYTPVVVALAVAVWVVPVVVTGAVERSGGVERVAVASARGAGHGVPVCARHLDAGRARERHQQGRPCRRSGQGWRISRTCGRDACGRVRQDGHAHDRSARRGPRTRDRRMGSAGGRSAWPPRSKRIRRIRWHVPSCRTPRRVALYLIVVEELTELPGRGVSGLSQGRQVCAW